MIEDPELRALFNAETEEHLQTLENGLLHLEAEPHDNAVLEEIFRSAHSLKGAAGMLGVESVEKLAHHFEDELGAVRHGRLAMSAAIADRLYRGVDAMRRLAQEAGGGEAAQVDVAAVLAQLRDAVPPPAATPAQEAPEQEREISTPADGSGDNARRPTDDPGTMRPGASATVPLNPLPRENDRPVPDATLPTQGPDEPRIPEASAAFKVETIRVDPQKLDALMTLAGEMTVTTTRVERALAGIDELMTLWEEWGRDIAAARTTRGAESDIPLPDLSPGDRRQSSHLQARERVRYDRLGNLLRHLQRTRDDEVKRLELMTGVLDESIRTMRLLPFSTLFNLFPRMVRDLSQEQQKEVQLVVEGGAVTADKHLLEGLKDPLMHLLRNAIDHGIEPPEERERQGKPRTATLQLRAVQAGAQVILEVIDDGRGLDGDAIQRAALRKGLRTADQLAELSAEEVRMLIFAPGFSTSALITDLSGRGVGLDVVRTNIEHLKGTITVESTPGAGCTFRMQAPITLATTHVLLVQVAQRTYALPVDAVLEICPISAQEIFSFEGRPAIRRDNGTICVARLADLLELPTEHAKDASGSARPTPERRICVLLNVGAERLGLFVDGLLEEQEVILKPFRGLLQRVRNVLGATALSTGEICMVLNPHDLVKSAQKLRTEAERILPETLEERRKVVLLAEDSITTRTQEKRILESAGYEVVIAVDGVDALQKLGTRAFDALVSDVEMPNMDGLALAERVREDAKYRELPIILVTSLASDQDRQRGAEVGANAYITKGAFDQTLLLNTLRRLV